MRVWRADKGRIECDGAVIAVISYETPYRDLTWTAPEWATFIVDACNAAEEEAAIIADRGAAAAATQRFRALELSQAEADVACSLIHQRVHGRTIDEPR